MVERPEQELVGHTEYDADFDHFLNSCDCETTITSSF